MQLCIRLGENRVRSPERVVEGLLFWERIDLAVDDLVQAWI